MSDFVNDNTALPAAKIDSSGTATPPSDPTRKWAPYDANVTFDALRSLRTAIVTGAYDNISKYGVVGDGTDAGGSPGVAGVNTNAFQAMLNTAPIGRPIFMPRGVYALSATVTRTRKGLILIGEHGDVEVNGGAEIRFSGSGTCIQLGADDGNPWDASEYNGPQGHLFSQIAMTTATPDTPLLSIDNVTNVYRAGTYGIWDWRGGAVVLESCRLLGYEALFVGVNSDFDRFHDCTISSSKYGIYLGPRSDQGNITQLDSFFCDRAVTLDRAGQTVIEASSFAFLGHNTCSGIEIRRGTHGTLINGCWFEKSGVGYSPVSDSQSFVSVGEVNGYGAGGSVQSPGPSPTTIPINGCTIFCPHTYSTLPGAYHTKYFASWATVRGLIVYHPSAYAGGSVDNFDSILGIQAGQTVNTSDSVAMVVTMRDQPFSKLFTNLGTGNAAYRHEVVADANKVIASSSHEFRVAGGASQLTVNATGVVVPGTAQIDGNATIGSTAAAAHTMRGTISTTAPSGGTGLQTTNSSAGQTVGSVIWRLTSNGSYDTTGGALFPVAMVIADTSTRSAGASSVGKTGISVDVSTGTGLSATAITTARGSNDFNTGASATTYFRKSIKFLGVATTNSVSTQQDNWSFTSMADSMTWILTITANLNITGFAATENGHRVRIYNPTAFTATLKHLVTSTAANQIIGIANSDTTIGPGISREAWYSTDSFTSGGKWVILG